MSAHDLQRTRSGNPRLVDFLGQGNFPTFKRCTTRSTTASHTAGSQETYNYHGCHGLLILQLSETLRQKAVYP